MCGIVGIISKSPVADRETLVRQRDTMCHRGPDDAGVWWSQDGRAGLAHRRLSIVDLSSAGHQPMHDESGFLHIVFNGMIYNFEDLRKQLEAKGHKFRSSCDTEVILAAYSEWGTGCLRYLNGMFAFGIYDSRERKFFLARDRAGEKPLFYSLRDGKLTFASELKALIADPAFSRRLDLTAFDSYLLSGYVPGELCILDGVKKLSPAHFLVFDVDSGRCQISRYWRLPDPPDEKKMFGRREEGALVEELEGLIGDSVKGQLISDVPIGILLSGGIDSSIVTSIAARQNRNIKTYTVRFSEHSGYDETKHARSIASHFGTDHCEIEGGDIKISSLPILAKQIDEPIADSSIIPSYFLCKLIREHCNVALGGDGGDELFAGYLQYNRLLRMRQAFGKIPVPLRMLVSATAAKFLPLGFRGRSWLQGLGAELNDGISNNSSLFDRISREHLMGNAIKWPLIAESVRETYIHPVVDVLQKATRMDFERYLADDILVKVDRTSMLNSLEVRAPLLDYRIIELAFGKVPSYLRASSSSRKIILRKLAACVLPKDFDVNRKQGFSVPLAFWLKEGKWKEYFYQILLGSQCKLFNKPFIERLLRNQDLGYSNSERLFGLVMFELWNREYKINL